MAIAAIVVGCLCHDDGEGRRVKLAEFELAEFGSSYISCLKRGLVIIMQEYIYN